MSMAHKLQREEFRGNADYDKRFSGVIHTYKSASTYLVEKKRYDKMVLICDEAHLMFGSELSPNETMTSDNLHNLRVAFTKAWSQETSHPLRVLFLTGTPVGNDPRTFFKLMNMIRSPSAPSLPTSINGIKQHYGQTSNVFDFNKLMSDLTGYISFLNMSDDRSQFAWYDLPTTVKVVMSHKEEQPNNVELVSLLKKKTSNLEMLLTRLDLYKKSFETYNGSQNAQHYETYKRVRGDLLAKYAEFNATTDKLKALRAHYSGRERSFKDSQEKHLTETCHFIEDFATVQSRDDAKEIEKAWQGVSACSEQARISDRRRVPTIIFSPWTVL